MAGQDRESSSHLKSDLLAGGHRFSFSQVIRLLRLFDRSSAKKGDPDFVESDAIRIRPELSLAFPAADIAHIEELPGEKVRFLVTATFLGLYGTSSPLPTFYTEDLLDEEADDESVARDFIDIINYRLFPLFFRCWTKPRQFLQVVEEENPQYLERLFCLLGLGEKELREDVREPSRLSRYLGLFTQFPRSALGLQTLLQDGLEGIPVDIIPCLTRRVKIPADQRIMLGGSPSALGADSFLGEEIEDRMGKFRLQLGPLNQEQFQALLPDNPLYEKLSFLTEFYVTESLVYDVELILSAGEARPVLLGAPEWSRLGLDTWIFSTDELGEVGVTFHPERG